MRNVLQETIIKQNTNSNVLVVSKEELEEMLFLERQNMVNCVIQDLEQKYYAGKVVNIDEILNLLYQYKNNNP